jgi:L-rhamnose mutarotase
MIRKAFRMSVTRGREQEYERRHRPIWKELEDTLIEHGARTYSIFLDPQTNDLFGYVEIDSEARWAAVASTDVCRRWWRHMRDIMPANADDSPVSRELREVFHINREGFMGSWGSRRSAGSKVPGSKGSKRPRREP